MSLGRPTPDRQAGSSVAADNDPARPEAWLAGHTTHSLEDDRVQEEIVNEFSLSVLSGPDAGARFTSTVDRAVVGTADSADFVLHDPTVSRFHCEIGVARGLVTIRDLESTNGTSTSGVRIYSARLEAGAVVQLGKTELRFELGPMSVRVPLSSRDRFGVLVGRSTAMRRVFAVLERVGPTDATLLLEGETGTGKEAAAESVHRESARRDGPFVVADCSAIPPDLLESELFGHERGAFTGAVSARKGVFEEANGGTLFLDEVGELGVELQPKLLRALERREVKPVGSNRYVPVDVRIIAATNRSLRGEVNAQKFRSDLYYRLAVVELTLPPLRERTDDIALLVDDLLIRTDALRHPESGKLRSATFQSQLSRHGWPGNVRELRNYIERCLALGETTPLTSELPPGGDSPDFTQPLKVARERWNRAFERKYVEHMLHAHGNNVSAAARAAGVDRMYFYRLLWRCGLK